MSEGGPAARSSQVQGECEGEGEGGEVRVRTAAKYVQGSAHTSHLQQCVSWDEIVTIVARMVEMWGCDVLNFWPCQTLN